MIDMLFLDMGDGDPFWIPLIKIRDGLFVFGDSHWSEWYTQEYTEYIAAWTDNDGRAWDDLTDEEQKQWLP